MGDTVMQQSDGISIHAPREGGDRTTSPTCGVKLISIHAPREGGDLLTKLAYKYKKISIHAPREGGDSIASYPARANIRFQSTPPARGATYW